MRLEKSFRAARSFEDAVLLIQDDSALIELFPNAETTILEKRGKKKTTQTRYRALGRDGVATFHFEFLRPGVVRFEKVCDGRVWGELRGEVCLQSASGGEETDVTIALEGRTKAFIPEFTIRLPMQEQIDEMTAALQSYLEETLFVEEENESA